MVKVTSSNIILSTTLTQNKKLGITGSIGIWVGSSPPDGALLCDGSSKSISEYPGLAASLGVTSGLTFNVPDLRSKLPLGTNSTNRTSSGNLLIGNIEHKHSVNQSRFVELTDQDTMENDTQSPQFTTFPPVSVTTTNVTSSPNTSATTQLQYLPPYFAVNFIIYT